MRNPLIEELHKALRKRNWWNRRAEFLRRRGRMFDEYRMWSSWEIGASYHREAERLRERITKESKRGNKAANV